jgi:hypothetical protein
MTTEIAVRTNNSTGSAFTTINAFEDAQRMAKALASSTVVPKDYQGRLDNCLVAMEIAQRTGSSVLAVMQSVNIIHGKPSWSSSYVIAAINSSGRFRGALKFKVTGEKSNRACVAFAIDAETGDLVEGPEVSMEMAKAEGWLDKSGSKWKTMPDLMLRYRAAAFFGRLYCPDILFGMNTEDELKDVTPSAPEAVKSVNERVKSRAKKPAPVIDVPAVEIPPETPQETESATEEEFF